MNEQETTMEYTNNSKFVEDDRNVKLPDERPMKSESLINANDETLIEKIVTSKMKDETLKLSNEINKKSEIKPTPIKDKISRSMNEEETTMDYTNNSKLVEDDQNVKLPDGKLMKSESLTKVNDETLIDNILTSKMKDKISRSTNEIFQKNENSTDPKSKEFLKDEISRPTNEIPQTSETLTDPTSKEMIKDEVSKSTNEIPKKSEISTEREGTLKNEDKTFDKFILTSKLAMNDKVLTKISVTSKLAMKNNNPAILTNETCKNVKIDGTNENEVKTSRYDDCISTDCNWDQLSDQYFTDENIAVAMPSVIGFITMSFHEEKPYEFTITTMTHYIHDKCDSENNWLYNLDFYIRCLNISVLYVAGTRQKQLISKYVSSVKIEFTYSQFMLPQKQKCLKCLRHGCSKFKATNILRCNFGYDFKIPCTF